MILSGYRSELVQGSLFEEPLRSHGHIRTVIGDLAERLTAAKVGGRRHRTQATADYCPDVSVGGRLWLESKEVGRSRTAFIYAGRLEKDRRFNREHPLVYAIWHHEARTLDAHCVTDLEVLVRRSLRAFYLVPFMAIDLICRSLREERLNSRYYGRGDSYPGYGSGFRIRLSLLDRWIAERF